jgi:hypothetical protein
MPRRVAVLRTQFQASVASAVSFAQRGQQARRQHAAVPAFSREHLEWVHEAALLKIFVAWETYLENVMGCYALGERSASGYRAPRLPKRRISMTLPEMLLVFRGDQRYVGWADPYKVIGRAKGWFRDGEPFTTRVGAGAQILTYLLVLRNAIAHESDTAHERFITETRRLYGAVGRSPTPGGQLLGPCPPGIPAFVGATLFQASAQTVGAVALALTP